jgi:integrase
VRRHVKGVAPDANEKSLIGNGVPLGTPNPKNPRQLLVRCGECGKERYTEIYWHLQTEVEAKGFIKPCGSCARKAVQRDRRNPPILDFPCGGNVNLNQRNPNNNDEVEATCGICDIKHFVLKRHWKRSWEVFKSYCEGCWPLARVVLRPEHATGSSVERDAIYTKIRDIRRALQEHAQQTPRNARIPFCVLAKKWGEQNPQNSRGARDTQSYNVNLLSFYFGTTPIGDIDLDIGMELRRFLLELPSTRRTEPGFKRSELSVNQTLMVLRRIFDYACGQRLLRVNPFPAGGGFTPSRRVRKPTPLVTVDEEHHLLAACTGTLDYLRAIIICLLDTGMNDADRQRLRWRHVDFNAIFIRGSGIPMRMTPRLHATMQALWERSDRNPESLVWGSKNITGFKRDLGLARVTAQVQGLHIAYFRPTAAWRMMQAGQEFLQIGSMLGCKPEYLQQYLETDPNTAQRESNSSSFKQFIIEQFGGSANSQKNLSAEKKRPGPEKGFNAKITEEKIREAYKVLGRYAPQEKLAEEIGVDSRSLREWHRERGLSYKQMQQQYTETGGS